MKIWRIALAVLLSLLALEAWARWRFDLNNPQMPSGIRSHMGVDIHEAFRLRENFSGLSRTGILYKTDELGFRIGTTEPAAAGKTILLGGDSRVFGFMLEYDQTLGGMLEVGHAVDVRVQALPGGSPAFFVHDMFRTGKWEQLGRNPDIFIYAYDVFDGYGDNAFLASMSDHGWRKSLRRAKVLCGGYFWNMVSQKAGMLFRRSRLLAAGNSGPDVPEPQVPVPAGPAPIPVREDVLSEMFSRVRAKGTRCHLLYVPRFVELIHKNGLWRDQLREACRRLDVGFIDGYEALKSASDGGKLAGLRPLFLDLEEGIHLSEKGQRVLAELVAREALQAP